MPKIIPTDRTFYVLVTLTVEGVRSEPLIELTAQERAQQVMSERLGFEAEMGFNYYFDDWAFLPGFPPPLPDTAVGFDECEAAGVDGTIRTT